MLMEKIGSLENLTDGELSKAFLEVNNILNSNESGATLTLFNKKRDKLKYEIERRRSL